MSREGYADGVSLGFRAFRGLGFKGLVRLLSWSDYWTFVWRIFFLTDAFLQMFRMHVPVDDRECELGRLCLLCWGFWSWRDEPESLILAQSERWRHA